MRRKMLEGLVKPAEILYDYSLGPVLNRFWFRAQKGETDPLLHPKKLDQESLQDHPSSEVKDDEREDQMAEIKVEEEDIVVEVDGKSEKKSEEKSEEKSDDGVEKLSSEEKKYMKEMLDGWVIASGWVEGSVEDINQRLNSLNSLAFTSENYQIPKISQTKKETSKERFRRWWAAVVLWFQKWFLCHRQRDKYGPLN